MKKLILIAALAATAMAQAATMATKNFVVKSVNTLSNNLNVAATKDPSYYKNSMWYLGTGTEGTEVTLQDHTCTSITLVDTNSTTKIQLPAPVIVDGVNRSRAMILSVECNLDVMPEFTWKKKDAAGNPITYLGRDGDETGYPTKGLKIIMISEVRQNTFLLDYAELEPIYTGTTE